MAASRCLSAAISLSIRATVSLSFRGSMASPSPKIVPHTRRRRQPRLLHKMHALFFAEQSEYALHRMTKPAIQARRFRLKIGQRQLEISQGSQQQRSDPEDRAAGKAAMLHVGRNAEPRQ